MGSERGTALLAQASYPCSRLWRDGDNTGLVALGRGLTLWTDRHGG